MHGAFALCYANNRRAFDLFLQRPKPKPAKMAFKSNTRRRDYTQESLLASEQSPRSIGADGSPILHVNLGNLAARAASHI